MLRPWNWRLKGTSFHHWTALLDTHVVIVSLSYTLGFLLRAALGVAIGGSGWLNDSRFLSSR